jgi:signal transduction histidine kinase/ActR/RegA family two-component response regulator
MTQAWFDRFMQWATPQLPQRFQEGRSPYLFFLVWVLIVAMLALAFITSYPFPLTLLFAGVLLVLLVCYARGMRIQTAVNLGLFFALGEVLYVSFMSGGIFSPRMSWLAVLPLVPFYAVSRRSGWVWLGICLGAEVGMAIMTWHRGAAAIDAPQPWSSFASYAIVMLVIMTVPFLYDNLYIQAYNVRKKRNQELEEKRQELLRTSALREQFIATVSHELRTPMNAILGFNAMLLARVKDNPQALKILNHTRQSADHLLTVINDVLDYSQLQAGQLSVHPEVFELRETVQTAFELFGARVESMHLSYRCEIGDTVPHWVKADRHRLMQVLVNLLGNAIKFTHQGFVTLQVQQLPLCVLFSVKDSGIGIAQAQQDKIFQRFMQADDDIQSRYGGNGLGLSISQRLVALMGGHIGFESQPGHGSTFWFTLPLTEVLPEPVQVFDTEFASATSERVLRFLVVDDHPINRVLAHQILQNTWKNCELVDADNGAKALAILRTQDFDVVLMDMVMPEMDGIEATRALRHDLPAPACDTPVLGLTANVNPYDLERFTASGVNAVLLKPFDQAKMCAQIERLLTEKKSSLGS